MAKRAKIKKVYSRRARTGIAAAPTNNFNHFNDYLRLEVDKKELTQVIKDYIRKNVNYKKLENPGSQNEIYTMPIKVKVIS